MSNRSSRNARWWFIAAWISGICFGRTIFVDASAHDPSECPVCPICTTCPECVSTPSPEQTQAVQRALEAIQAVEIGEDLPLGAPPPRDSPL
jgi:hypothetical protein